MKDILKMKVDNGFPLHKKNKLVGDDRQNVRWRHLAAGPKKTNLEEEH